jgi:diadenosine tetraphosphate (Ap4A) HIT family hydrolase
MPDLNPPEPGADCPFCRLESLETVLYECTDFVVIADFAPVADAHILLIPRGHYPHLAALPNALYAEFESLKARLGDFVRSQYGALTFWENGVFGQSVPHGQQRLYFLPLPQGQGSFRPGFMGTNDNASARPECSQEPSAHPTTRALQ